MGDVEGTPHAGGDLDAGLANERTFLAWNRTSLSLVALAGVVLRFTATSAVRTGLAVTLLALGCSAWVLGAAEYRAHAGALTEGRSAMSPRLLRRVARTTVAMAVVAFVVGALPGRS